MRQKYKKNNTKQLTCYFSFIIKFIQKHHHSDNQHPTQKNHFKTDSFKNKKTSKQEVFFYKIGLFLRNAEQIQFLLGKHPHRNHHLSFC